MRFKPDLDNQLVSFSATVGLVIWPVKIVPEMTYYVSSGTLNPTHSLILFLIKVASSEKGTLGSVIVTGYTELDS